MKDYNGHVTKGRIGLLNTSTAGDLKKPKIKKRNGEIFSGMHFETSLVASDARCKVVAGSISEKN